MEPFFLAPYSVSAIWAGSRLSKIRGAHEAGQIGISREVCAYKGAENVVESGEFEGQSIRDVIENHTVPLMGGDISNQLIRIAYIDTVEDLSLQVHPVEEYARVVEDDYEKAEAWYILDCAEDAYVIAGTTISDADVLKEAALSGALESFMRRIPVKKGDFILIPAGLLHACGKDMLAIEIGSFGGITYRIYDFGRGRELDIEKGFDVLVAGLSAEKKSYPKESFKGDFKKMQGIAHPLFRSDVVDIKGSYKAEKGDYYTIVTVVEGMANLIAEGKNYYIPYTRSVIIPACIRKFEIVGECRILESYGGAVN